MVQAGKGRASLAVSVSGLLFLELPDTTNKFLTCITTTNICNFSINSLLCEKKCEVFRSEEFTLLKDKHK